MNALAAYNVGATGAGVGMAIIDTGIDLQSGEFGARISPASRDVAGNATIDDEGGHGTAVAFTAAGRRNGAGTHGVAFDATLIVLRADRPGSCATQATDDTDSGCRFGSGDLAVGVDAALAAGARVINMSLGGATMPQSLRAAIGRATAAGIVVVIAAGNDGTPNPDDFAAVAENAAVARDQVIVAGSIGASDAISSFSDKAGTGAAHFLTAVGERVRAPDETDTPYLWSGTSFAAPQITGAVALLAQAFPNLTGAQIVDLLFRTARDTGETGTDSIYGRGVLDLTRAFQPVGTTSVAGFPTATVSSGVNAMLSAPMGDAQAGPLGAVILDSYGRAFATDLGGGIGRAAPVRRLAGTLQARYRQVAVEAGGTTLALTLTPSNRTRVDGVGLTSSDPTAARATAGMVTQRVGHATHVGLAFRQGAASLTATLAGVAQPAFLVTDADTPGFDAVAASATAIRLQFGRVGVTAAVERGDIVFQRSRILSELTADRSSGYLTTSVGTDMRFGALATTLTASRLAEHGSMLGASFDAALGAARGTTWFFDSGARWTVGDGWMLGTGYRVGHTRAVLQGLDGRGALKTRAFSADLGKDGVFGHDSFGLRVAQPLRVSKGGIDIALPTYWDYASSTVATWTTQRVNLAPRAREVDVEARYAHALAAGLAQANMFWRTNPGHIASVPDYGLAVRYSVGF